MLLLSVRQGLYYKFQSSDPDIVFMKYDSGAVSGLQIEYKYQINN